jgi:spore coat protein U-like protein
VLALLAGILPMRIDRSKVAACSINRWRTSVFGSIAALHDRQKTARSSRSDVSTKPGAIQISAGGESGHLRYKRYVPMTIQTRRLQLW